MAEPDQGSQTHTASPDSLVSQAESARKDEPLVQTSSPLTLVDAGIIALILGVALWYLYRQFWRKRGACGGCAKGAGGGCAVARTVANASASAPSPRSPQVHPVSVDAEHKRSK
ncbi:hypothetical protein [Halochromatium roseum]|uniref:hypothetical protein n=1 Tax=Halochromatium roseum TaxID=391920 RepID=UPI0019138388|nr:hypothetical protein [Halochromatium roseum]MBK5939924.1 hypothetical protein [Halochromatium roseum]